MISSFCVIGFTLLVSILVGMILGRAAFGYGVPSLPISVPMGICGGVFVARLLKKENGQRGFISWVSRGCMWGALLGAIGTTLWFSSFNLPYIFKDLDSMRSFSTVLLVIVPIGTVSGVIVGSIVGIYCYFVKKTIPENKII